MNATALWQNNLPATPSLTATGAQLTAHVLPHNKGAYATLMTTTYDVYGFTLLIYGSGVTATQTDQLLDVAIGPNQEHVIIPTWPCGWKSSTLQSGVYAQYFKIKIPAGTLVSARIQALITLDTVQVLMIANAGASDDPGEFFSGCDAYGINAAASQGTSHTPGNSGAESTTADIGSTTSKIYGAIAFAVQGTLANTSMTNMAYHWELVIGGVVRAEWLHATFQNELVYGPWPGTAIDCHIPVGTQLRIQAEASGTAIAQDVAFFGFY